MKFCSECGTALVTNLEKQRLEYPKCGAEEPIEGGIVYSKTGLERDKIRLSGRRSGA